MYTVRLQDFEGPLDLLLFFIKRDELDIYDIPIARLTQEFLSYLHYIQELDIEVAGEFIVMAAELMQVKAKMLLPPEPGEAEEMDPRANLVQRLVEYKRYKETAEKMTALAEKQSHIYFRGYYKDDPRIMQNDEEQDVLLDVALIDLITAFRDAIENMPKILFHDVVRLNVTIDEQVDYVLQYFEKRSEATFEEIVSGMQEKIRIVVTFIALLELCKQQKILIRQKDPFGIISIMKKIGDPILVQ